MTSSAFFLIFLPCLLVNAAALMALIFGPMRKPGSPTREAGGAILLLETAFLVFLLTDFYVKYLSRSLYGIDFVVDCLDIEVVARAPYSILWGIAFVYFCQYATIFFAGRALLTLMGRGRDGRFLFAIGLPLAVLTVAGSGCPLLLRGLFLSGADPRALAVAASALEGYLPAAVLTALSILFLVAWLRGRRAAEAAPRALGDALGAVLLAYYPVIFMGGIILDRVFPSWRSTPWSILMAGPYLEGFAASLVVIAFAAKRGGASSPGQETEDEALDARLESTGLTPRESEIARLILRGCSNKEISQRLGISPGTVKNHVFRLFRKLGVGNRFELNKFRYGPAAGAERPDDPRERPM